MEQTNKTRQASYVGRWVTQDGDNRHELLPNGRYDEVRGNHKNAYRGRYILNEDHVEDVDDTGFTADRDCHNGVLCHAGMILYGEEYTNEKGNEQTCRAR
jgi:hypothetical protein